MSKNYKKFSFDEVNVDKDLLEETPIHGDLDIEQLIFRQIEYTNRSASEDETLFAANVRVLLSMIPANKRDEIVANENEYESDEQRYEYKYNCGVPMGTPEHPVCGSPRVVQETITDWHMLYQIILSALEDSNLTWKREKHTIEVGAVEDKVREQPAPVFADRFRKGADTDENKRQIKHERKCAICHKQVEPNTGQYFKIEGWSSARIVHKDGCWDRAILQWGEPIK